MSALQVERQLADGTAASHVPSLRFLQAAADVVWEVVQSDAHGMQTGAPDLRWFQAHTPLIVGVRAVDARESQQLNRQWRDRDRPTNVLSFPSPQDVFIPPNMPTPAGDLVICASVVSDEAAAAGIAQDAHWAHMMVHGCLHLIGYDHIDDADATRMEQTEIEALARLGFADPYVNP